MTLLILKILIQIELRFVIYKKYKKVVIYYVGYITYKNLSYVELNSVNSLYFLIDEINGYFAFK